MFEVGTSKQAQPLQTMLLVTMIGKTRTIFEETWGGGGATPQKWDNFGTNIMVPDTESI
jgi:hypothetical protein